MPRKKKDKNYFTQDTEDAILEYLATEQMGKRNKIYNSRIHYSFYKLAENLIHTFKFYYTEVDDLEDLKYEVISFLLEKLHYFDPTKGSKAYSYFSIVGKNYLIAYNNKNYAKKKQHTELDLADSDVRVLDGIENSLKREDKKDFLSLFVEYMDKNIDRLYPDTKDNHIADTLIYVLRQRDHIEIFNKKAIYIYVREITKSDTPPITRVVKQMKQEYYELYNQYAEYGDFIEGV
jgi:hypothetical protein